jgi:membrane-associated PAP2 superfamily phosphatase
MRQVNKETLFDFLFPLFLLVSLTTIFWFTNADIELQRPFYLAEKGWYLAKTNPWYFLYRYGMYPAIILVLSAALIFVSSLVSCKTLPYRRIALFLILHMLLGPGLVVNAVFKDHWGRPRPTQIVDFGGQEQYLPPWKKGSLTEGKSFPSGHASIGFFLFSPFFFLRKNTRRWAVLFLFLGLSFGSLMGLARMIQGGHFASDVLWSGGFTYLTGLTLYYFFRFDKGVSFKIFETT